MKGLEGLLEGVRSAAAVVGEEMRDERRETGLKGMLHTARVWGLGDYGLIGVE